jgi:hypothetical protein
VLAEQERVQLLAGVVALGGEQHLRQRRRQQEQQGVDQVGEVEVL